MNIGMGAVFLCAVLVPAISLLFQTWKATSLAASPRRRGLALLGIALTGIVLFARPHQDTFLALDTSDYRIMRQAFAAGRGLHETDGVLLSVPPELRRAFMLDYTFAGRDTRDLAFQLIDGQTLSTAPFFYPALPLAELGFSKLLPFPGSADLFMPVLGFLLFCATMLVGLSRGGVSGSLGVLALWLVSPLPLWCLRGAYAEAVGVALALLVAMAWLCGTTPGICAAFALGIGISFHPLAATLSVPLLAALCFTAPDRRHLLKLVGGFSLGLLPLVWMTLFICTPYGNFLDPRTLAGTLAVSGHHRIVAFALLACGGIVLLTWLMRRYWPSFLTGRWMLPLISLFLVAANIVGIGAVGIVRIGAIEAWHATRWGGLLLLGLAVPGLWTLPEPYRHRTRMLCLLALGLAPALFALKGLEPTGLWSQRRIFPWVTLCICCLSPALASFPVSLRPRGNVPPVVTQTLRVLLVALILLVGLSNVLRWPAAWLGRFEKGSDAFVTATKERLAAADLVVFDYHPHSVPFAVDNRTPVLGVGQQAIEMWPGIVDWLGTRAATNELLFVSPWSLPGVEQGLALEPFFSVTGRFDRVRSKTSLPAVWEPIEVVLNVARMRPLHAAATASQGVALDKTMDRGLAALRGPWGRADIRICHPDGHPLPARWSRKGSSVVGPLPPRGGEVLITIEADACREDDLPQQRLNVVPPWNGDPVQLTISNGYNRVAARLIRPVADRVRPPTGLYGLDPTDPYSPASVGIRGFSDDLGVLVHRIGIEPIR